MYPDELDYFINCRNKVLGGDDLLRAIDTNENTQINHIEYNPANKSYQMWDVDGRYYYFTAMPYAEAQRRGLVKSKTLSLNKNTK